MRPVVRNPRPAGHTAGMRAVRVGPVTMGPVPSGPVTVEGEERAGPAPEPVTGPDGPRILPPPPQGRGRRDPGPHDPGRQGRRGRDLGRGLSGPVRTRGDGPHRRRVGTDGRRGERPGPARHPVLVATRDARLLDAVLAAAASCGVEPIVARESAQIRQHWGRAPLVLVGADLAPCIAGMGLAFRTDVHIVGDDPETAAAWSVPLGASALVLPGHAGYLPALLTRARGGGTATAVVIDVMGGSGGVGASTLAGAMAQRCVEGGLSSVLVDLDPCSGGVDLLFGAEREPGWRWSDLASAAGTVGDLSGRLPRMCGVDLLAATRTPGGGRGPDGPDGAAVGLPGPVAVRAVLDALARSYRVVVLDDPSPVDLPGAENALRLLVVAAEVRSVMSARARAAHHGWQDAQVVVRTGRGLPLDPGAVSDSLGLPVVGVIGSDPRLPAASRVGEPPARAARRRYLRQVDALVEAVIADA